ncbi:SIMPL domain-containing protein [Castellaniella sp. S9]|uniref:SIMPL domain-containing protein n=1 Tax=Castellaniella sp. S9 TaxID=2993652 RepID=UPI0022B47539|nr:SIMPL domain-containing protein [Castellaniella sp. S9]
MYPSKDKRKGLLSLLPALILAGAALGAAAPAAAHGDGPDGRRDHGPRASLHAQASSEVAQDTVRIMLAADLRADTQTDAAEALNTRLDTVMQQAKGHEGIEVRSGGYRIWPSTGQDGKIAEWRGRAEIILTSKDFAAASQLAADLGDRMPISGISFSVSSETRAATEQKLLVQAVDAFKTRAQALTDALGFASYRYDSIDLGGSGESVPSPMPRMMMAKAADAVAAPLEGGTETISVAVSGTIRLQPASTAAGQ